MLELLKYVLLGIIQGITEILPISSSGHLTLFSHFLGMNLDKLTVFLMLTNTGSFLAILFFFRKDVAGLVQSSYRYIIKADHNFKEDFLYVIKVGIAVIPVGIAGLIFENILPNDLLTTSIALFITGSLLLIIYLNRHFEYNKNVTFQNAIAVGLFQMFAVVPGISRSGITLVGGLSQKLPLKSAMKFSFLSYIMISIPVSVLGFIRLSEVNESVNILGYGVSFILSFIFSYYAIRWFYRHVKVKNLIYFSVYCFVIGTISLIIYFI